jgi:hypothetical protein
METMKSIGYRVSQSDFHYGGTTEEPRPQKDSLTSFSTFNRSEEAMNNSESHHHDDNSLPDPIEIDTARERLEVITTDPDVWAGFERWTQTNDFDGGFLTAIVATRISLAHVFQGRGSPFVPL